jgi:hypothetical protein
MKASLFLVGVVVVVVIAGACGKAEDRPGGPATGSAASPGEPAPAGGGAAASPAATAPTGQDLGHCKIDITGDVTASAAPVRRSLTDSKVGVGTDHWLTDDELKMALRAMAGIGGDKNVDRDAKVAEGMKQDPRLFALIMNCGDEKVSASFMPGNASRYADIPKAPKKYVVTSGAKAGEFNALLSVGDAGFTVKGPGTLDITRFDSSRLEGTFAFDAEERFGDKRNIKVTGSFQFACSGSQSCGK